MSENQNDTSISVKISTPTSTRRADNRPAPYRIPFNGIPRILLNRIVYLHQEPEEEDDDMPRNPNVTIANDSHPYVETAEARECSVCQNRLLQGAMVTALDCAHIFHTSCIDEWVKYKEECPMCRTPIQVLER